MPPSTISRSTSSTSVANSKECALHHSASRSLHPMVLRFRPSRQGRSPTNPSVAAGAGHGKLDDARSTLIDNDIPSNTPPPALSIWQRSRQQKDGSILHPGAYRPLNFRNFLLALQAIRHSAVYLFFLLWGVHPLRFSLLIFINMFRGILPALRSYSQAMLLDEVQAVVTSRTLSKRLFTLFALEICRMLGESIFDHYATQNESTVQKSARFKVEYLQLQTRLRLDIPTLSDPMVQDLLQESEAFARSFHGGMGGLGLLSPFDLVKTVTSISSEVLSQGYVLWTLLAQDAASTSTGSSDWLKLMRSPGHLLIIGTAIFPTLLSILSVVHRHIRRGRGANDEDDSSSWPYPLFTPEQSEASETHERMRRLAYDDAFKAEVLLFGLADWILKRWVETREIMNGVGKSQDGHSTSASGSPDEQTLNAETIVNFTKDAIRELSSTLQTIPLILQLSTTSLGSITLYRNTIHGLVNSLSSLRSTVQLTFQGIFLMAAFHASIELKGSLSPRDSSTTIKYETMTTTPNEEGIDERKGMKIECKDLWFTYPNQTEPTIKGLNLVVQPGETVAVVGQNGSGKTTLMHLLLRLYAPSKGSILINDQPISRYDPADLHAHSTAVFQSFGRLVNAKLRENTGVGCVEKMDDDEAVGSALKAAGLGFLEARNGDGWLDKKVDAGGFRSGGASGGMLMMRSRSGGYDGGKGRRDDNRLALSGGQWQRVALSRAFMRPEADLVVLDEASSQLDAHAQNGVFGNVVKERGSRTILFITHRLSTVKWADKVAFFDKGTITEFGSHEELMALHGSYASLYNASESVGTTGGGSESRRSGSAISVAASAYSSDS
ncbi:hypothetical protein FRC03_011759 [Tulasnella sp. 419]|nr:hypothetical protein FRC03_011759 [Tulasnella sp. 419]